jgi:hypothetical protein
MQPLVQRAVMWRWPGNTVLTAGMSILTWSGPDARPQPAEVEQAVVDYIAAGRERQDRFVARSRERDVLAFCALIVRARGIAAWNAMTVQQKKDATLAEADAWTNIRDFIESNL